MSVWERVEKRYGSRFASGQLAQKDLNEAIQDFLMDSLDEVAMQYIEVTGQEDEFLDDLAERWGKPEVEDEGDDEEEVEETATSE